MICHVGDVGSQGETLKKYNTFKPYRMNYNFIFLKLYLQKHTITTAATQTKINWLKIQISRSSLFETSEQMRYSGAPQPRPCSYRSSIRLWNMKKAISV